MNKADITRNQIRDIAFALRAENWNVTLVYDDVTPLRGNPRVIPTSYSFNVLLHPNTVKFLRAKNANGYHVYSRPNATQFILVDDLCIDALDQIRADGHKPAAVVMTSEGNYQAWITVAKEPITTAEATASARLLAQRYGGDPGAAKATQLGRMPGTTNRKEMYQLENGAYPFTELRGCMKYLQVTEAAARVLAEAREVLSSPPFSSSSTRRVCALDHNLQSDLFPGEAAALYHDVVQYLFKRFGRDGFMKDDGTPDRSRIDYAVAQNMKLNGATAEECAAVLMTGSEKAQERGLQYVETTIGHVYAKN